MAVLSLKFEGCEVWEQESCLCDVWDQGRFLVRPLVLGSTFEQELFPVRHGHVVLHLGRRIPKERRDGLEESDLGLVCHLNIGQSCLINAMLELSLCFRRLSY